MKIALLASSFLPRLGGAEVVVHNLALGLQRRGHAPVVITWWGQARALRGRLPYPVWPLLPRSFTEADRRRWEEGRGRSVFVAAQLAALQLRGRFDVWNIHLAHPLGILAVPHLARRGIPAIITCHGDDVQTIPERNYGVRLNPHLDAAVRTALAGCRLVTAISPSLHAACRDAGVPEERLVDIPNGVDTQRLGRPCADRAAVRRRLGWPADAFVALSVAASARALGVGDRLHLHPGIPADQADWQVPAAALVEVYQAADALVSVSLTEGFPVTVLEGMACGLPVVATDVTGNRDVVRDGDNGYLVGVEQLNTIPDRIGSLAADLPLRGRLGDAARRTAARYDWDGIVSAYLDAYERARRP